MILFFSACQPASPAAENGPTPVQVKLLATVFISPTPGEFDAQATRFADRPTATEPPSPQLPTPTPYIGIFLGQSDSLPDGGIPDVNAAQFATPGGPDTASNTSQCRIPPSPDYGALWQTDSTVVQALGCPKANAVPMFDGTSQIFQRGVMYYRPTGEIWAIAPGSNPAGTFWYLPQAPDVPQDSISAPDGLRVPTMGFGAVWRTVPGVRDALGFGRTDETGARLSLQTFDGGMLLFDGSSGQAFALIGSEPTGRAYGPY